MDHEHLIYLYLFAAGLAISLGLGWALGSVRPREEWVDSVLLLVAPASLFVLSAKSLMTLLGVNQADTFCSGRLAPAIALLNGYSLYYPIDSGPIFNTIYAPMAYLVYLPAGLFGSPTEAVLAGTLISYLLTLGPVLLLCLTAHGEEDRNGSRLVSASVFLAFWKFAITGILAVANTIHADAPAMGFGVLACAVLYVRRREPTPSSRTLLASAIFASMAVWSKQTSAALLGLLPLWVLLAHGVGPFLRFCGWIAASMATVAGAFVGAFGLRPMMFNVLDVPKSHPWISEQSYIKGFLIIGSEQLTLFAPILVPLLPMLYFARRRNGSVEDLPRTVGGLARLAELLRGNYWTLFAGVSVGMVPLSLVSRIKFGGTMGSLMPAVYYLSAGACVMFLDWHARNREKGLRAINDALKIGLLASPFGPLLLIGHEFLYQIGSIHSPYENAQEQAYRYAIKHPHEVYFPWNPLSTLMAEGKAYHFEYGVFDRDLGGFHPSEAHYREHLPRKLRLVAFPPNAGMKYSMMRLAKDFKRQVPIGELPGWLCYER